MPLQTNVDLSRTRSGLVIAPAGCGKTELIITTLRNHVGHKPVLVLTHTNAGVSALRLRLQRSGVKSDSVRLFTIDGWALKLATMFPQHCSLPKKVIDLEDPRTAYPRIREAVGRLLAEGHLNAPLNASYDRLIVDEYQDCSMRQHLIVKMASVSLETCVLGDPLQAIFGFSPEDPLVPWNAVVEAFGYIGELTEPWRWLNAGQRQLGSWLLDIRTTLQAGRAINLRTAPPNVTWIKLSGNQQDQLILRKAVSDASKGNGKTLIIGSSTQAGSRHKLASAVPGATIVEPVDLGDLIRFSARFRFEAPDALELLLDFAACMITGANAPSLKKRVSSLHSGRAKKDATPVEQIAMDFELERNAKAGAHLLSAMCKQKNTRIYRPTMMQSCLRALQLCELNSELGFEAAALQIREEQRALGRSLPKRAVGSTLLLKGLEAESAVILCADELDQSNLYVALTRGSTTITVCSRSQLLQPK